MPALKGKAQRRLTADDDQLIKVMFERDMPDDVIATALGCHVDTVANHRRKLGLLTADERAKLERKSAESPSITQEQAAQALAMAPLVECLNSIDMRLSEIADALLAMATRPDEDRVVVMPVHQPSSEAEVKVAPLAGEGDDADPFAKAAGRGSRKS